LFTTREFGPSSNRVFAFDTRLKLRQNLTLTGQWMTSWTRGMDGHKRNGTAALVRVSQSGRKFHMNTYYRERSPDFETQLGFIQRVNMRETGYDMGYSWRPEKSALVSYGPHRRVRHLGYARHVDGLAVHSVLHVRADPHYQHLHLAHRKLRTF
jgi:hypothetical protein